MRWIELHEKVSDNTLQRYLDLDNVRVGFELEFCTHVRSYIKRVKVLLNQGSIDDIVEDFSPFCAESPEYDLKISLSSWFFDNQHRDVDEYDWIKEVGLKKNNYR